MTALINNAIVALMVGVVAAAVFLGTAVKEGTLAPEVRSVEARWVPDGATPSLVADLAVANPGKVRLEVQRITYEAELSGRPVDAGSVVERATLMPGETTNVAITIPIPTTVAEQWWDGWIRGEAVALRLHGTINATAGRTHLDMPFDWTAQHGPGDSLLRDLTTVCGSPELPCLSNIQGGAIADPRTMPLTLFLRAPEYTRADVTSLQVKLSLGDIVVAEAEGGASTIPWGYDVSIPLLLKVSSTALASWWPTHLERCEESPVRLTAQYQVRITNWTSSRDTQVTENVPGEMWRTPLLCDQAA